MRKQRKIRRSLGIRVPAATSLTIYKGLLPILRLLKERIRDELLTLLAGSNFDITFFLERLKKEVESMFGEVYLTPVFEKAFARAEKTQQQDFNRQLSHLSKISKLSVGVFPAGPRMPSLQERFIKEHVSLIKGFNGEALQRIEQACMRGIRSGHHVKQFEEELMGQMGMMKKKANQIARHSALQVSGSLVKESHKKIGIKKYRWQTSGDNRVRSKHSKLNGKVFSWSGVGPHPREEHSCRCDAIPVY